MYCKNCGNFVNDNANFCNHCGASVENQSFATPGMDKKEYFDSPYSSERSKKMITASKILIGVLVAVIVFSAFVNINAIRIVNAILKIDDINFVSFLEEIQKLDMNTVNVYMEDLEEFKDIGEIEEEFEKKLGFSPLDIFATTFYASMVIMTGSSILILLFAVLGFLKLKKGFAVTALILSVLFAGSWIILGITIALLIIVNKLNDEYNAYCANGNTFNNGGNEPYFGA